MLMPWAKAYGNVWFEPKKYQTILFWFKENNLETILSWLSINSCEPLSYFHQLKNLPAVRSSSFLELKAVRELKTLPSAAAESLDQYMGSSFIEAKTAVSHPLSVSKTAVFKLFFVLAEFNQMAENQKKGGFEFGTNIGFHWLVVTQITGGA